MLYGSLKSKFTHQLRFLNIDNLDLFLPLPLKHKSPLVKCQHLPQVRNYCIPLMFWSVVDPIINFSHAFFHALRSLLDHQHSITICTRNYFLNLSQISQRFETVTIDVEVYFCLFNNLLKRKNLQSLIRIEGQYQSPPVLSKLRNVVKNSHLFE